MLIVLASLLTIGILVFILSVRAKDLPQEPPVSPFAHLDERKASIYENLRDLQFEYRVGKMSDEDYQPAKQDLQKELAQVLAGIDKLKQELGAGVKSVAPAAKRAAKPICPHCGAQFEKVMKFCGECGKKMEAAR
ncbi:MAG: zinc ribbon domain-containing protein [Acidobacteria bacterium]|nr:zinc ribbon domain-containing protein [Acidobacteriota bacterium]